MLKDRKKETFKDLHKVNEQIPYPKMQIITDSGESVGILTRYEALARAREEGCDLVLMADRGADGYPIAKLMDFGKMLYAKKKKLADAKKKQKIIKIKELKMRPKIDEHDYQTKMNQAMRFLSDGNRVKFTIMFRGRELATKFERGQAMFSKIDATLGSMEIGQVEHEEDMKLGNFWSRVYFIKSTK